MFFAELGDGGFDDGSVNLIDVVSAASWGIVCSGSGVGVGDGWSEVLPWNVKCGDGDFIGYVESEVVVELGAAVVC